MTTKAAKVQNITSKKSNYSNKFFRVGTVRMGGQKIAVFDMDGGGHWLRANPDQFN